MRDVARLPENQEVVERLIGVLAGHVRATARDPGAVPVTDDAHAILAHGLPPGETRTRGRW